MSDDKKYLIKINNRDVFISNVSTILVGKKTGNSVVLKDSITNTNYLADEVKGEEIYNSKNRVQRNWLLIDLETGGRGWFPGSITIGTLVRDQVVQIKEDSSEESSTLKLISNVEVEILDILDDVTVYEWYHVRYEDVEGYIKTTHVESISYKRSEE